MIWVKYTCLVAVFMIIGYLLAVVIADVAIWVAHKIIIGW